MHYTEMTKILNSASEGGVTAQGCDRLTSVMFKQMESGDLNQFNFSLRSLALALGVMDPYAESQSLRENFAQHSKDGDKWSKEALYKESNAGVGTNAFQVITGEFFGRMTIEGYEAAENMIADELVKTVAVKKRGQKIPGVKALGGPNEVREGHPYEETGFEEKYVTSSETKYGRILSLNEETIISDEAGIIADAAMSLGEMLRIEKERLVLRAVQDADTASGKYVYRPSGTDTALYATDGSLKNYIGSGGVTGYNAAKALVDWESIAHACHYRATQVTDDRIDGTQRPIAGLNGPSNILLVPTVLHEVALIAAGLIGGAGNSLNTQVSGSVNRVGADHTNPVSGKVGNVLSSPYVDEVNTSDWYYGNFKKQFVWTEYMPIASFFQGGDSDARFERDVLMRIKVRYSGGVSAKDTVYVTKVDGA